MTFTQLVMENALINELTNQRRLYSAAVVNGDKLQAQRIMEQIKGLKAQINNIKEEKIMTREEKLISMRGVDLIHLAIKLGVRVSCNKGKTQLKESKAALVERIIEFEAKQEAEAASEAHKTQNKEVSEEAKQNVKANTKGRKTINKEEEEHLFKKKEVKKPNLKLTELTYKGETKSIREWADERNMPWPTLYDRVNRNGWSVEDALETPLGQRRKK